MEVEVPLWIRREGSVCRTVALRAIVSIRLGVHVHMELEVQEWIRRERKREVERSCLTVALRTIVTIRAAANAGIRVEVKLLLARLARIPINVFPATITIAPKAQQQKNPV